jgi:hypothetical protein
MRSSIAAFLLSLLALPSFAQQDDAAAARRGVTAVQDLLKQRPQDPTLYFYLARFQSEAGDTAACVASLDKVLELGDGFLPGQKLGFDKSWNDERFQSIRAKLAAKLPRLDFAPTVMELDDREMLPEGIAWDPKSQSFFIGSTTEHKIVRIAWGNVESDFATANLDGVLGLAVDGPRRTLYAVSTSALTEAGRRQPHNAVVAFDVDTARFLRRVEVPEAAQLNDVTVAIGGRVFATDSGNGAVYEIPKEGAPRVVVPAGTLRGSNGLAASPDGKLLYVAHSTGLAVVDVSTGTVKRVNNATRENVAAIDGLYQWQGQLLGVENVTNPGRVVLITLSREGDTITKVQALLSHHHNVLDEPTTGAVTDHGFFLLAATGVSHLNAQGKIDDPETLPKPAVVRIPLPR